ncbi:tetratricopeptide repeat-containing sensor histidine kinase [Flavobacterium sp. H122]|uniref:tetratricopeptide repeat-containing sensor histidine kinase n=1 Tax=Flavobacterium sp. H122 TaxID=2529860 RepID=UPI0010AA68EB|nr:tetratricopeptide repeat-containing sensor histidine kinase [Flavobacterium sp. H122]
MNRSPFFLSIVFSFLFLSCNHSGKQIEKKDSIVDENKKKGSEYQNKADSYYTLAKYDSAFYFYTQAKVHFDSIQNKDNVAYCLIQIARTQQVFGDYFGSEASLIEAMSYVKENKEYLSAVNNLLGISAKELKNYGDALRYYNNTYKLASDSLPKAIALNNIANVYSKQGNYKKSVNLLGKILKWKFLDTLPKRKAIYMNNLGYAYTKLQEKEKGLQLMQQALAMSNQEDDSYGRIESYLYLSEYYLPYHSEKSRDFALQAYKESSKHNSIDERLEALLLLIKTSENNRNYALKYAVLNDSITQVRNTAKNQFAKIRYDARMVNEENLKLKNKNMTMDLALQKSQNETNTWIGFAALLALLLFIVYNHLKNKGRLEKQKASYLTETKIAKKIHDEIANDVFQTMSFVETRKIEEPEHKETLINLLDTLYQRSRNISKENESIETGESFIENLIEMINGYKSVNQNVIIKKDETINWGTIAEIKKITLFRVLQELLVNMKKHSQASIVIVSFANHKNDIAVDYSDNGKGFATHQVKKSGMANVENRIQNINGKITFDTTGHGLKVKISIPK